MIFIINICVLKIIQIIYILFEYIQNLYIDLKYIIEKKNLKNVSNDT